jgi:hypothetical protein
MLSSPPTLEEHMLYARTVGVALAVWLVMGVRAASTLAQDKPDATGTWKWTQQGRQGGNPTDWTAKLKQEGEKVTGTVSGTFGGQPTEMAISDGTFKDGTLTFNIVREFNEQRRVTKYSGKLDGDTIKGKMERERQGEKVETDWEAKRVKEPAK